MSSFDNIRLVTNQNAFEKYGGFYYTMDHGLGMLVVKTDDGHTAYMYPLDTALSNAIIELHHDGKYFWSMEDSGTALIIRKWFIQNFLCKLQLTITLTDNAQDTFSGTTFAIEHYHRKITNSPSAGSTSVVLDSVDQLSAGDTPTLMLGPNSSGQYEEKVVTSVDTGTKVASFGSSQLLYSYTADDPAHFNKSLWLFNNHYLTDAGGALYELNLTGGIQNRTSGAEYANVTAATFASYNYYNGSTVQPFLLYMQSAILRFIDVSDSDLSAVLSSLQDVFKYSNPTESWTVYSIAIEDTLSDADTDPNDKLVRDTIYRLQNGATYGTQDSAFSGTTSYAITTVKPFVNSISISATPGVIPADSVTTSSIVALVRDQYNNPLVNVDVDWTEDDGISTQDQVNPVTDTTDANGSAATSFTAGSTDTVVTITATVDQVIV